MKDYLDTAAAQTKQLFFLANAHHLESTSLWDQLFSRMNGTAIKVAAVQAESINARWKPVLVTLQRVEATLRKFRSLWNELQYETNEQARKKGVELLDKLCAMELEEYCTGEAPTSKTSFADFAGLSFSTIHQINYAIAPPHVQKMVDNNPDVTLLEVGTTTSVAAVYSGGPAGLDELEAAHTQPATVTTFVPGTGSSQAGALQTQIDRTRLIAKATGGPAMAWLGYNAPDKVALAARALPATQGGKLLTKFQKSADKRWPKSQKIVVAYSFGTVVAGSGDLKNSGVDDLVLAGSPGTTHDNASEIGVNTWYTRNQLDEIWLARGSFGPDPSSSDFGAQELPHAHGRPGGHHSYFQDPAFFAGLSAITRQPTG